MPDQQAPSTTADGLFDASIARASAQAMPVTDLFSAASALTVAGQAGRAAQLYKVWIAFNPADPLLYAVYFNYGTCLRDLGDLPGAIAVLRDGIRLRPDFYPPYINVGRALEDSGQVAAAVTQWIELTHRTAAITGEALHLKITALQQVARVLEDQQQDAGAEDALRDCLSLDPAQREAVQHWIALRQRQCKWPVLQPWDRVSRQNLLRGISPLSLANLADDPLFQLASADDYCRHTIGRPQRPDLPAQEESRDPSRKLRIGYVSSDLREHAVGFAMTDVFETHDRSSFEIYAYYCGIGRDDSTKRRIQAASDRWIDINSLDDAAAARRIVDDGIDILVDLNGYTKSARTKIFAMRPAPIAVNWFGFPGTLGSPYHNYIIADSYVVPEDHERFYSERVLRLPCYQPNDRHRAVSSQRPTRQDENLPEKAVVFCCLNGMQKLTQAVFARWMTILVRVPDSVLWLLSGTAETNERLRTRATLSGVSPDRLIFADKKPNPDHLARYPLADLFLDTLPYGAHTTAADALWMGVPILTQPGRSFASRVCGSVLTAAGLRDTITATPEAYVECAVELGLDRAALAELKARLTAGRDTCLLFDTPHLVRHLEDLYRVMWTEAGQGRLPTPQLGSLDIYHTIGLEELDLEASEDLKDEAYLARYRDALIAWNDTYPIAPDNRLWTGRDRG
ncbi:glycosyl transferase [Lichenibacterium minor]|uniref:protein O-GlcNAc transferase n=1 Tax=Lichenibacterium minor TaxID=2316528 RepID=A0A4Q2U2S9_9HYPH|nr:glycosyl transferase [Lichenibacterium minor]RYC30480.1 glycosyl transferase [Lichenibacterium minor]